MINLDKSTIRQLKGQAHSLKPVISIGNKGLTQAVLDETDRTLNDHELIKIRLHGKDRAQNKAIIETLCEQLNAHYISSIGFIFIIYRQNSDE